MGRMPWAVYLWPGLPQLWARGSWSALAVAVFAGLVLNLATAATFAWTDILASPVQRVVWLVLAASWIGAGGVSLARMRKVVLSEEGGKRGDTFSEAVDSYLQGDYFQAERLLVALLEADARDLDARLLLATLLRHLGRREEAIGHLDTLECFQGAEKWELEVRRERELLEHALQGGTGDAGNETSADATRPIEDIEHAA